MTPLNSPFNSTQFLIENGSAPFFDEEDDNDIDFTPNKILLLEENEASANEDTVNSRKNSSFSTQYKSSVMAPV